MNVFLEKAIHALPVEDVQCDEIWSFAKKKEKRKNPFMGDDMYIGNAWCFVAIERKTKLVLTFELGKRTETSTRRFAKVQRYFVLAELASGRRGLIS